MGVREGSEADVAGSCFLFRLGAASDLVTGARAGAGAGAGVPGGVTVGEAEGLAGGVDAGAVWTASCILLASLGC